MAADDVLAGALTHANRKVRRGAVEALGETGSSKAIPGLLRALKDSDADVRRAAAEALGELRGAWRKRPPLARRRSVVRRDEIRKEDPFFRCQALNPARTNLVENAIELIAIHLVHA